MDTLRNLIFVDENESNEFGFDDSGFPGLLLCGGAGNLHYEKIKSRRAGKNLLLVRDRSGKILKISSDKYKKNKNKFTLVGKKHVERRTK